MPEAPTDPRIAGLLEGLNPQQRDAVVHGEGPLLVLAGAGSGKTRVLTHRIAHLMATDQARAGEILAITFTNKAAQEMRDRVEHLVGRRTRAMWVLTFHAACARMLRADGDKLGYTRQFTIYDTSDSRRMMKRCLDEQGVDTKRFTPAAVLHQVSSAKNKLLDAEAYKEMVGSYFEQTVADAFDLYERELHKANAMDFDDLLVRAVNVLELFQDVRDRYSSAFRQVMVDEYQDTNHAQYRWLELLTKEHRNLMVVGDDAQCLVEGTQVTMGDGTAKPIEHVQVGDEVLSSFGSGDLRPSRVTETFTSADRTEGIAITTRSGRRIVSTPDHTHFAGYRLGVTPQLHSWILETHASERDARFAEHVTSLTYRLPTVPFVARRNGRDNGLVGDQATIDRIFDQLDTESGALALLEAEGLRREEPHHMPRSTNSRRRVLTITLCADRRGQTPMHSIAMGGRDNEGRDVLRALGLNVRPAKAGSASWRYESCFKTFGEVTRIATRIAAELECSVKCVARLGSRIPGQGNTLAFTRASAVRPGMAMFREDGTFDVVERVERVTLDCTVYDINVADSHNFIADGLITHNSVYGFRGADIGNILSFEDAFPDAFTVKLEQNYRSTQTILSAANAVIAHNRDQKPKSLWTDIGEGDPIVIREMDDEFAEARYVVGQIERMLDEGAGRREIAIFYRTNAQSLTVERILKERGIGYQIIGGTKFFDRAEIKDAIAYLTCLGNGADQIAFGRIVNSPKRGIGQTSLGRVNSYATSMEMDIWDAAADAANCPGLGKAAIKALGRFMDTMQHLRETSEQDVPVGDLLEALLSETGYVEALESERTIEAQGRIENLQRLVEDAREFDATAEEGQTSLADYLQSRALIADADARVDDDGLVTMMTLHNAKGLEYPIVFIVGAEEGVFPHSRALDEGGLEEERRLMYVGITRAMRHLELTYARRRNVFGATQYGMRSRFLDEIPVDLTDRADEPTVRQTGGRPVAAGPTWSSASAGDAPANDFRMGDDVVHQAFGDGVVTGVEPGGIVVVRFAGDGSERKLMADFAPIAKR